MIKKLLITSIIGTSLAASAAYGQIANLIDIYHAALKSDPKFQQALAQRDIAQQQLPLSVAALLPQINLQGNAGYTKTKIHGDNIFNTVSGGYSNINATNKTKNLGFTVTLSQTIFNFTNWMNLASAKNSVKSAYATYTAAVQTLIQQTVKAYFAVLLAKETLDDTAAEKRAFYRQYIQAKESYEVGVKTITDMYNAKASYDSSVAKYVTAENNLEDARENLRAITGIYYPHIAGINRIPLLKPNPTNINKWSQTATRYNWSLIAARYTMLANQDNIKAAFGGHLPSLNLTGSYSNNYNSNVDVPGSNRMENTEVGLQLNLPIFSGGQVTAQVKQAIAEYDLSAGQYQQTYRSTVNDARQAYLGVISGISKIQADKQTLLSNRSTLKGMEEGYKVGTQTMTNVLIAESQLYSTERQYALDRNQYINNLIDLKLAAGTLTVNDVMQLNTFLSDHPAKLSIPPMQNKKYAHRQTKHKKKTLARKPKTHQAKKAETHKHAAKATHKKETIKS